MWPSLLTCTLMTSPQRPPFMLLGRVGQPSTRRYGLGSSVGLGYRVCWACAAAPNMAIATALAKTRNPARLTGDIVTLQSNTRIVCFANGCALHWLGRSDQIRSKLFAVKCGTISG